MITYVPVLYAIVGVKILSPDAISGGLSCDIRIKQTLYCYIFRNFFLPGIIIAASCNKQKPCIRVLHVVGNSDHQVVPPYGSGHFRGCEAILRY